jgi:cell division septation protein DedD
MLNRAGGETPLTYRMLRRDSQWAIRDVIVDGVSVVGNYQAQFSRIIQTSSYAELLGRLRARLAEPGVWVTAPESQREQVPVEASLREGRVRLDRVEVSPAVPPIIQAALDAAEPRERAVPAGDLRAARSTAVPAAPPPAPAVAFWVQVGSFRSMEAARRLIARLRGERLPVQAEPEPVPMGEAGHTFARVRVGPFGTRDEAAARLRELQAKGFRPFIAEVRE